MEKSKNFNFQEYNNKRIELINKLTHFTIYCKKNFSYNTVGYYISFDEKIKLISDNLYYTFKEFDCKIDLFFHEVFNERENKYTYGDLIAVYIDSVYRIVQLSKSYNYNSNSCGLLKILDLKNITYYC
jgi:hypothetical protein